MKNVENKKNNEKIKIEKKLKNKKNTKKKKKKFNYHLFNIKKFFSLFLLLIFLPSL